MREGKLAVGPRLKWGTWEELILGSAVLRHGKKDWNLIASELRVRTVYPFSFTPEVTILFYLIFFLFFFEFILKLFKLMLSY